MREAIGLVPAAGQGSRLRPFRYPKELFPLGYAPHSGGEPFRLKVVCEYAFECLVAAGVRRALVVISDPKVEILRFLSEGREVGVDLAYLHQRDVVGLPAAIDCAYPWVGDRESLLVLPDTVVEPPEVAAELLDFLRARQADVALAVFPTDHPGDLCPVETDAFGRVRALHDKQAPPGLENTWGLAAWTPRFATYLHELLRRPGAPSDRELPLAEVFSAALAEGLEVVALPLARARFWDIGKNSSLLRARQQFETPRLDALVTASLGR